MTKSLNDEELEKINGAECGMDKNEYKAFLKKHIESEKEYVYRSLK